MSSSKQTLDLGAVTLPLEMITMRTAVYGDSGAGKTTFARLLAEKIHEAKHRFCAIDLKNDWYGLKSSADGAAAGIPVVIFGGPRADVRLIDDAAAARAMADTVASIDQSVVLDLDAMSRAKQERFLTAFLDALYEANRRPLLLFCDEADRYAPQKPMSQDALMSLSSSEDIARRGRKRGIGSFWLTQRPAVLNKNVSEFANLTVVFRTPGEKDLKELEDRVGRITSKDVVKEVMRQAPGLADGEAFFLSAHPKLRKFMPDPVRPVQLPLPWTFDSSATPGVGQRRREPKVLARTDLAAIEERMAAQVEQAKAEDPKHLRAELARLKAALAKAQAEKPAPAAKERRVEVPVVRAADAQRLERLIGRGLELAGKVGDAHAEITKAARVVEMALESARREGEPVAAPPIAPQAAIVAPPAAPIARPAPRIAPAPRPVARPTLANNGDRPAIKSGARAIGRALCQWHPQRLDRETLRFYAGFAKGSGTFTDYLSQLRKNGMLDESAEGIGATHALFDWVGPGYPDRPTTPEAYLDNAMSMPFVKAGARRIGEYLIGQAGRVVPREELRQASGFEEGSGTFTDYVSQMRRSGILVDARGGYQANPVMFESPAPARR
jgi:hypothetical protein